MAYDHGMMLMRDHVDAYVDAMLMVNMQANTRSVTSPRTQFNIFAIHSFSSWLAPKHTLHSYDN